MKIFIRITKAVAIFGFAVTALSAAAYYSGVRINTTKSIPIGIYLVSSAPVGKGAYVLFCPPPLTVFTEARERGYIDAGFCPGNYSYMMKRVLAAKNDTVNVSSTGVRVNGQLLPYSVPRDADGAGRRMPRFQADTYTLGQSELLLMSDVSSTSFDGRYFGPISKAQIKTVIRPVVIW